MPEPYVTALIDTYNHERFIEEAVESVLRQNLTPGEMEVLVVDDGSTDHTLEIVRRFGPRVRVLQKANGGQASAFNAGIPEARGEIIAFLDGDDWWAPGKLAAVVAAFDANPRAGLVGHGIAVVDSRGQRYDEVPREGSRFRITSRRDAKMFRTRRGFLGTSRMAYRRDTLRQIGLVPETSRFEADEYLFTLAAFLSEVVILREALTFYRVHGANLFQAAGGSREGERAKQQVLAALAQSLSAKLNELNVPKDISRIIVECVQGEADVLRLSLDSGYPWETISAEWIVYRALHSDASLAQHLFSFFRLLPALLMPSATYYRWRGSLANSAAYQNLRQKFFPFPVPRHVKRQERKE